MRLSRTSRALLLPLSGVILNAFVWNPLADSLPAPNAWFNAARIALYFWAGWRVVALAGRDLGFAALTGAFCLFVDHVLCKGGSFLVHAATATAEARHQYLTAFGGVLVSGGMFIPLAVAISVAGGLAARRLQKRPPVAA
jgi:hypothetical protein